jgi:hypothetical protein
VGVLIGVLAGVAALLLLTCAGVLGAGLLWFSASPRPVAEGNRVAAQVGPAAAPAVQAPNDPPAGRNAPPAPPDIKPVPADPAPPPGGPPMGAAEAHRLLPQYGTKRPSEEQVQAILACLKDNNDYWRGQAVNHIEEADVVEAHRAEIARGLVEQFQSSDVHVQVQAVKALARWGTKDSIVPLIRFLDASSDNGARGAALEALGKLKDPRAIDTIVEYLPNGAVRDKAGWALKNFGAAAETKVAAELTHKDRDVRREACQILKVIGTARSLPALQAARNDESRPVAEAAEDAIRVIQKRQ